MQKIAKRVVLNFTLAFFLAFGSMFCSEYEQQLEEAESNSDYTMEDLEAELDKTLKKVKDHFDRIQDHLDYAGVGRDPVLDEAIQELEKEQQSLLERLEGLGTILLNAHEKKEGFEEQSETTFEDVEVEAFNALHEIDAYIEEREQYWEGREVDPETMLEEELRSLEEEQERLEEMLGGLEASLEEAWEDVIGGWGESLEEWQILVEDLFPEDS